MSGHPFCDRVCTGCGRIGWVLAVVVCIAARTGASEPSLLRSSEGIEHFHADDYQEALALLERAIQADDTDFEAHYDHAMTLIRQYRQAMVGELRLGDRALVDRAIEDLRRVLALKSGLPRAVLELGIALVEAGDHCDEGGEEDTARGYYREASEALTSVLHVPDFEPEASLFLGMAQFRLGETAAALRNLERAAATPALEVPAAYYQGVIYYRQNSWGLAEAQFARVLALARNSDMGRESKKYLDVMGAGRSYSVYGAVGFEYDSNVVLAPSDEARKTAFAITDQADGRATITVGGGWMPLRTEHVRLSLAYEFYQSLYFNLTNLNLQDHRPSVSVTGRWGRYELGAIGQYDYDLLGGESFVQQGIALPWVRVLENEFGHSELYYRFRGQDYMDEDFDRRVDGFDHAIGARQFVYLGNPERSLWVGYRYDLSDVVSSRYDYNGHLGEVGVRWTLPRYALESNVAYWLHHEDYGSASQTFSGDPPRPQGAQRRDNDHAVRLSLQKKLTAWWLVRCSYYGAFSQSNQATFEYDRHVASVATEVRF